MEFKFPGKKPKIPLPYRGAGRYGLLGVLIYTKPPQKVGGAIMSAPILNWEKLGVL